MAKIIVEKSGPLNGRVKVSGAKNAVLKHMAASLLTKETCVIDNVPRLKDVEVMKDVLEALGSKVKWLNDDTLEIITGENTGHEAPYELMQKMRASFVVMGPLVARTGKAKIALPGGCQIGERKIDLHLKGLKALGANIEIGHGYVEATCGQLVGDIIYLDFPSVGATENIMMAATLADGVTEIENAAKEPEIVDLANFLNKMGANIKGAGTDTIRIKGVEELTGTNHSVVPDRIEAGTFMLAAAMTGGDVVIEDAMSTHVRPIIAKLKECGVDVETDIDFIRVKSDGVTMPTDIKSLPFPGFPTDMQAQFMALLSVAKGNSTVTETVFENRFMHVGELIRMGANIKIEGHSAIISGTDMLQGAQVKATDLRCGAALVLAGLMAEGRTEIHNIYHIDRGYDKFEEKLRALGANIWREA